MKKCIYLNTGNDMEEPYKMHHTVLLSSWAVWWHCSPSHTQQKASLCLHYRTCASNVFLKLSPIDKFTSTWSLSWERSMCHCPQMLHSFSSRIFHTTISNLSKSLLKTHPIVTAALILHHTFQHPLMTAQSGRSKCPGAVLQIKKFHKIVWIFFFWFLS